MNDELHDIPDPSPHLPGMYVPWYVWVLLGALVLGLLTAVVLYLLFRRRAAEPPDIANVYDESRRRLGELREQSGDLPLARLATEASFAVRRYLAACLSEPALYETHEEFLLRDDALEQLPAGSREHLNPLLEELAAAKYGPSEADPAAADALLKKSLDTLQGLESTRNRI